MDKANLDKALDPLAAQFARYQREILEKEIELLKLRLNAFDEERVRKRFKDAMLRAFEGIGLIPRKR